MPRELILGTAGHIDHGKTALIKALTGVDCDRLPEEKSRGITIDIGFAKLELDDLRVGVVDVPGHERFIRNMLAGASGIDLALLVVAADDSVMPQTREHFEILKLLGINRGIIALTKCDLVDKGTRDVVRSEIRELIAGSFLANAPIICTSVHTGEGLDHLRKEVQKACSDGRSSTSGLPFRLSIDRAFVIQGHGTVVTGSVVSGRLRVGDEVEWLPRQQRVRVRSLHNHGMAVDEVHHGMRAAINLASVDLVDVERGQELAAPGYLIPSRTITVQLSASPDAHRPPKHRLPVRLHIGTAEVMGILSLLNCSTIAPSQSGFAQIFLDEPVHTVWNQPFVLRDSSGEATLGGGRVLQPVARKLRRADMEAMTCLTELDQLAAGPTRASAVAQLRGTAGVVEMDLIRDSGIETTAVAQIIAHMKHVGDFVDVSAHGSNRLVHKDALINIAERIKAVLARLHANEPLVSAHDRAKVQAQLDYLGDDALVGVVIDRMLAERQLIGEGRRIARADFQTKLSGSQRALKDRIVAAHAAATFQPPEPASFAHGAAGQAANLHDIYVVAVAEGMLKKVNDSIYLHAHSEAEMLRRVRAALENNPSGLTVAAIRDLLETTRKYAVPICEYLDRTGVTKRVGDIRVAAQDSTIAYE